MRGKMIIDEKDIFMFVFFPEKLDDEKRKMIESNSSFDEAVDFYNKLKLNSQKELPSSVKKKLAEKIPAYNLPDVILLYPLVEPRSKTQNSSRLAASTKELNPKTTTKTFVDKEKEYLIKVMNYENETKIFVFSTSDEIVKDFELIIEPKSLTFHLADNSEPLTINHTIDAEKIQLKFKDE
ncbi:MAG: hypothetical protein HXY50_04220 [Ignavibacteriaceae bacterium]|nr:hypothetical protein [Ignavibacteriaceae bacterium]